MGHDEMNHTDHSNMNHNNNSYHWMVMPMIHLGGDKRERFINLDKGAKNQYYQVQLNLRMVI